MPTPKKIETVTTLTNKVKTAKALILADYQGLKHKQLEDLRKALKKVEAEFVVSKNTLLLRAFTAAKKTLPQESTSGSTGTLFAYADEAAPVQTLAKFFKTISAGKIKGGLLGTTHLSAQQVDQLAGLPNRQILLSQLAAQLEAPLFGLHNALSWNIRELGWTLEAIRTKKQ